MRIPTRSTTPSPKRGTEDSRQSSASTTRIASQRYGQGWALEMVKPNLYNLFSCALTEQTVVNAVNATGLPYSYNELSEGPHNGPFWYAEDPNSLLPDLLQEQWLRDGRRCLLPRHAL